MDLLREKLRASGQHRACFGGDSSSSSSSNTSYNYTDNRAVSSVDSHNDSRQDNRIFTDSRSNSSTDSSSRVSTTTVTASDFGAISAGQSVSIESLKQNSTNTALLFTLADRLFTGTANTLQANQQLTESLSNNAMQAYDGATAQATGNRTMMLAALAVVGVVGFMAVGKH